MFIPRIDFTNEHNDAIFIPELVYVPDDLISTIWNGIIKPYKQLLNKLENPFTRLFSTPILKLESMNELEEYCNEANSMYFTEDPDNDMLLNIAYIDNNENVKFKLLTIYGEDLFITSIRYYLSILFAQQIQNAFNFKHNKDIDIMYMLTPPSSSESATSMLKKLNSRYFRHYNCTHVAFSTHCIDYNKDIEDKFVVSCKKIGNAISKSIQYPDKVDRYVRDFMRIKDNEYHIIPGTPITFIINNSHTDSFKSRFITLLYKNGKLIKEKHGLLTKSKYMEMQMNLLQLLDDGDEKDRWVLINGVLNYIND